MSEPTTESEQGGSGVRRVRFLVSYRGTGFHGFAANPGVRTVMGDFAEAVAKVVRSPVELTGAGRTDAGVHAWGQVISGDLPADTDLAGLARRVNKLCAPDAAVRSIEWAEPDFDARFSATWRQYRYHVWNDPAPNPLLSDLSWHVAQPLDVDAMQMVSSQLLGEHDFSSFCRRPGAREGDPEPSMVRILFDIAWERLDASPLLRFEVRGSAFCHHMVRSIVGTMVDIGRGRIDGSDLPRIIAARDRSAAGGVAPPTGLLLWAVGYDGSRWDAGDDDRSR